MAASGRNLPVENILDTSQERTYICRYGKQTSLPRTNSHCGGAQNGNAGRDNKLNHAPEAPSLKTKDRGKAFSADKATSGVKKEIKLTVEFPLRAEEDHPNDLALYFKRFATILFALDPTMVILNWDHLEQNPIRRSKDIDCNEQAIHQYYS